ncbi:DMT family transporter [Eubacteriaceae bacterium ES3]|nr:DMT family transporter [Eubacteriaceae bacterium ES3]
MKLDRWVIYAILAALLFGLNAPFSKLLVNEMSPLYLAAFLYLGAGVGMLVLVVLNKKKQSEKEAPLTREELPSVVLMILLDIAAPIFLMVGISQTNSATAALLGNFEIVATTLIAMIFFREAIGKRLTIAIVLITLSSMILTLGEGWQLEISIGAVFVLLACICWGFENNFTRNLSSKDPAQVVILKGFGSGTGALVIALIWGHFSATVVEIFLAMLLGFVAYGLSILFYIKAQRGLGAARTSAYYAAAPFMGVVISWIIFGTGLSIAFAAALMLMLAGTYFTVSEDHAHDHRHEAVAHEHQHCHDDKHHDHQHDDFDGEHSHAHEHEEHHHSHQHLPDIHHRHIH